MSTIKAGTYRFNDVLTAPSADIAEDINYSVTTLFKAYDVTIQGNCNQIRVYLNYDGEENVLVYTAVSSEPDFSSAGVSYPIPFHVYDEVGWNYTDYDEGIQTITISEDSEVSAEFYEWFNKNAVEQRQISGVWKFKDELTVPSVSADKGVKFSFILNGEAVIDILGGEAVIGCSGMELIRQDAQGYPLDVYYICETSSVDLSAFGITLPHSFCVYDSNGWRIADYGEGIKTVDFGAEPQTVSADFYEWFTANATRLGIDFSMLKSLTIPEGVVTQITDASGAVIWSATIKFTMNGETYIADRGMTWAEWFASSYNTTGETEGTVKDANGNEVSLDSVIVGGTVYEVGFGGGMAIVTLTDDTFESYTYCSAYISYATPNGDIGSLSTAGEYELPIGTSISFEVKANEKSSNRLSVYISLNDTIMDSGENTSAYYAHTLTTNITIEPVNQYYNGGYIAITEE